MQSVKIPCSRLAPSDLGGLSDQDVSYLSQGAETCVDEFALAVVMCEQEFYVSVLVGRLALLCGWRVPVYG
jgi:hypothetical protein